MEGHERANVEARIKCLRNIQVLLDAAVMEMQQYSSVVSQLDMTSKRPEAATRASVPNSDPGAGSEDTTSQNKSQQQPTSETGARPKIKSRPVEAATTEENTSTKANETNQPANGEHDEVRKRRLERFGANAE